MREAADHTRTRGFMAIGMPHDPLVDISGRIGARKYALYRLIEDDRDGWYLMDDRYSVTPLTRERFQEILMDFM